MSVAGPAKEHWEAVYRNKRVDEVSWYQADPRVSLELVAATGVDRHARILDVGGGASVLVDRLHTAGFGRLGVLDISGAALEAARERMGPAADAVEWIEADVRSWRSPHPWDLWHDRAVFHFLTDPEDRARYRETLLEAVAPGGHVIVATFGPEGPRRCSGLDAVRYSAEEIAAELGSGVRLVESRTEFHRTPAGVEQQFAYARMMRIDEGTASRSS